MLHGMTTSISFYNVYRPDVASLEELSEMKYYKCNIMGAVKGESLNKILLNINPFNLII